VKKDILKKMAPRDLERLKHLLRIKSYLQTLKRLQAEGGPKEEIEAIKKLIREGMLEESKKSRSDGPMEKKRITCPYWCPSFGERCPYRCPTAIPLYISKSHLIH
jgi:hypothetical protein